MYSFSSFNLSSSDKSSTVGTGIKSTASSISPKRFMVPIAASFCSLAPTACALSYMCNNWLRFSLKPSMAPQRMRLSSNRLLTTLLSTRLQKSTISVYRPCSLRSRIKRSIALSPTFLIPPSPKRIESSCTAKLRSE